MKTLKNSYPYIFLTVVCLLFSVPLLIHPGLPFGNDLSFHLSRLESLKTALMSGSFLPGVYSDYFSGMGYGNGLFYPDLFLYLPVLLMCLGLNAVGAMKLYLILLSGAAALSMYGSLRYLKIPRPAALFSAVMVLFSAYHVTDLYVRFNLGELQAFVFLPLILAGWIDLIWGQGKSPFLLIAGFSGLILSHILTAAITALFFGILILCFCRKLFKAPFKFKTLGLAALGTLALTAFFTLPMLEQMLLNPIWGDTGLNGAVSDWAVPFRQLFLAKPSLLGSEGVLPAGIGLSLVFCGFMGLLTPQKPFKILSIAGWLFLWMASDLFPWTSFKHLLQTLQFPWRFYLFTTLLWAFVSGPALAQRFSSVHLKGLAALVLSLLILADFTIQVSFVYQHYPCIDENPYPHFAAGCEYLPESLDYSTLLEAEKTLKPEQSPNWQHYRFYITERNQEVPVIYYPGYNGWLQKAGAMLPISLSASQNGLIQIDSSSEGEVSILYQKTPLTRGAFWISLFSALLLLMILFRRKKSLDP